MQDKSHSDAKTLPGWNHVPDVPIAVSPFFSWPPEPKRMVQWIAARWLRLAENSILVVVALVTWAWFQPSLETTKTLSFDWIAFIWLRNIVLMSLVAGGLHWFFYMRRGQGERLKFDPRELMVKGLVRMDWSSLAWICLVQHPIGPFLISMV
jgi:hypothetical protein